MPRKKKQVEVAEETVETPVEETVTEGTKAVVKDTNKVEVRVYTKEKNGDNFAELAESFVSNPKRAGYTVTVE